MTIYTKPIPYTISHIVCGMISFYYPSIGFLFIVYQLIQLYINKRFFLLELKLKDGNSVDHTLVKLTEFFIGYVSILILKMNLKLYK